MPCIRPCLDALGERAFRSSRGLCYLSPPRRRIVGLFASETRWVFTEGASLVFYFKAKAFSFHLVLSRFPMTIRSETWRTI